MEKIKEEGEGSVNGGRKLEEILEGAPFGELQKEKGQRICREQSDQIPKTTQKLPLLIYIHGGAFCICSPFNPIYHNHLTTVVAEANVVALSVHYRLAPEHPLPIAYDDSWAVIQWAASHAKGNGTEPWLNDHADLERVSFAGDSAGANLAHNMAMRVGAGKLDGLNLNGMALIHPFFLEMINRTS